MKKIKSVISGVLFSLRLTFSLKEGAKYSIFKFFIVMLNNISPIILTIFPGLIVNELFYHKRMSYLVIYVLALAIVPLLKEIVTTLSNRYIYSLEQNLSLRLMSEFYLFILRMDYETLENPDLQEELWRARGTYTGSISIIDQVIDFFIAIINIAIYSIIIVRYDFLIIIIIATMVIINFLIKKHVREKIYESNKELDKCDRKLSTISYMFDQNSFGKEFRLFDLSQYLVDKYITLKKEANSIELKQYKKYNKTSIIGSITYCTQQIVLYSILIFHIFRDNYPVGDLSIALSAAGQFSGKLKNVFDCYLQLYERSMYVEEMNHFFRTPNKNYGTGKEKPKFEKNSTIEFKNVSFKYPGSDTYALKDFSIKIKADEKLCIVGQNGSGKSTFIKLLTRLYLPCSGEITLNGININEYDYALYQKLFAPVFQDFVQYEFSAKENIILNSPEDNNKLLQVIKKTGLDELFKKLPKGLNSQVGKYIDPEGFEPSGGEAQRLAIARALYRGGNIYLLDEPTAALDPIQEYEIYSQFNDMITDRCAILITHRLSAVQLADKVAVFHNGKVIEYGTHSELYSQGGVYTEMFDKQAQFYRDAPEKAETTEV